MSVAVLLGAVGTVGAQTFDRDLPAGEPVCLEFEEADHGSVVYRYRWSNPDHSALEIVHDASIDAGAISLEVRDGEDDVRFEESWRRGETGSKAIEGKTGEWTIEVEFQDAVGGLELRFDPPRDDSAENVCSVQHPAEEPLETLLGGKTVTEKTLLYWHTAAQEVQGDVSVSLQAGEVYLEARDAYDNVLWAERITESSQEELSLGEGAPGDWTIVAEFKRFTGEVDVGLTPLAEGPSAGFRTECEELECTFDATPSQAGDAPIVAYTWDFGDGGRDRGEQVHHAFPEAGSYPVTLTVADDNGETDTIGQQVSVEVEMEEREVALHDHRPAWVGGSHEEPISRQTRYTWTTLDLDPVRTRLALETSVAAGHATVEIRDATGDTLERTTIGESRSEERPLPPGTPGAWTLIVTLDGFQGDLSLRLDYAEDRDSPAFETALEESGLLDPAPPVDVDEPEDEIDPPPEIRNHPTRDVVPPISLPGPGQTARPLPSIGPDRLPLPQALERPGEDRPHPDEGPEDESVLRATGGPLPGTCEYECLDPGLDQDVPRQVVADPSAELGLTGSFERQRGPFQVIDQIQTPEEHPRDEARTLDVGPSALSDLEEEPTARLPAIFQGAPGKGAPVDERRVLGTLDDPETTGFEYDAQLGDVRHPDQMEEAIRRLDLAEEQGTDPAPLELDGATGELDGLAFEFGACGWGTSFQCETAKIAEAVSLDVHDGNEGSDIRVELDGVEEIDPGEAKFALALDVELCRIDGDDTTDTVTGGTLDETTDGTTEDCDDPNAADASLPAGAFAFLRIATGDDSSELGNFLLGFNATGSSLADKQSIEVEIRDTEDTVLHGDVHVNLTFDQTYQGEPRGKADILAGYGTGGFLGDRTDLRLSFEDPHPDQQQAVPDVVDALLEIHREPAKVQTEIGLTGNDQVPDATGVVDLFRGQARTALETDVVGFPDHLELTIDPAASASCPTSEGEAEGIHVDYLAETVGEMDIAVEGTRRTGTDELRFSGDAWGIPQEASLDFATDPVVVDYEADDRTDADLVLEASSDGELDWALDFHADDVPTDLCTEADVSDGVVLDYTANQELDAFDVEAFFRPDLGPVDLQLDVQSIPERFHLTYRDDEEAGQTFVDAQARDPGAVEQAADEGGAIGWIEGVVGQHGKQAPMLEAPNYASYVADGTGFAAAFEVHQFQGIRFDMAREGDEITSMSGDVHLGNTERFDVHVDDGNQDLYVESTIRDLPRWIHLEYDDEGSVEYDASDRISRIETIVQMHGLELAAEIDDLPSWFEASWSFTDEPLSLEAAYDSTPPAPEENRPSIFADARLELDEGELQARADIDGLAPNVTVEATERSLDVRAQTPEGELDAVDSIEADVRAGPSVGSSQSDTFAAHGLDVGSWAPSTGFDQVSVLMDSDGGSNDVALNLSVEGFQAVEMALADDAEGDQGVTYLQLNTTEDRRALAQYDATQDRLVQTIVDALPADLNVTLHEDRLEYEASDVVGSVDAYACWNERQTGYDCWEAADKGALEGVLVEAEAQEIWTDLDIGWEDDVWFEADGCSSADACPHLLDAAVVASMEDGSGDDLDLEANAVVEDLPERFDLVLGDDRTEFDAHEGSIGSLRGNVSLNGLDVWPAPGEGEHVTALTTRESGTLQAGVSFDIDGLAYATVHEGGCGDDCLIFDVDLDGVAEPEGVRPFAFHLEAQDEGMLVNGSIADLPTDVYVEAASDGLIYEGDAIPRIDAHAELEDEDLGALAGEFTVENIPSDVELNWWATPEDQPGTAGCLASDDQEEVGGLTLSTADPAGPDGIDVSADLEYQTPDGSTGDARTLRLLSRIEGIPDDVEVHWSEAGCAVLDIPDGERIDRAWARVQLDETDEDPPEVRTLQDREHLTLKGGQSLEQGFGASLNVSGVAGFDVQTDADDDERFEADVSLTFDRETEVEEAFIVNASLDDVTTEVALDELPDGTVHGDLFLGDDQGNVVFDADESIAGLYVTGNVDGEDPENEMRLDVELPSLPGTIQAAWGLDTPLDQQLPSNLDAAIPEEAALETQTAFFYDADGSIDQLSLRIQRGDGHEVWGKVTGIPSRLGLTVPDEGLTFTAVEDTAAFPLGQAWESFEGWASVDRIQALVTSHDSFESLATDGAKALFHETQGGEGEDDTRRHGAIDYKGLSGLRATSDGDVVDATLVSEPEQMFEVVDAAVTYDDIEANLTVDGFPPFVDVTLRGDLGGGDQGTWTPGAPGSGGSQEATLELDTEAPPNDDQVDLSYAVQKGQDLHLVGDLTDLPRWAEVTVGLENGLIDYEASGPVGEVNVDGTFTVDRSIPGPPDALLWDCSSDTSGSPPGGGLPMGIGDCEMTEVSLPGNRWSWEERWEASLHVDTVPRAWTLYFQGDDQGEAGQERFGLVVPEADEQGPIDPIGTLEARLSNTGELPCWPEEREDPHLAVKHRATQIAPTPPAPAEEADEPEEEDLVPPGTHLSLHTREVRNALYEDHPEEAQNDAQATLDMGIEGEPFYLDVVVEDEERVQTNVRHTILDPLPTSIDVVFHEMDDEALDLEATTEEPFDIYAEFERGHRVALDSTPNPVMLGGELLAPGDASAHGFAMKDGRAGAAQLVDEDGGLLGDPVEGETAFKARLGLTGIPTGLSLTHREGLIETEVDNFDPDHDQVWVDADLAHVVEDPIRIQGVVGDLSAMDSFAFEMRRSTDRCLPTPSSEVKTFTTPSGRSVSVPQVDGVNCVPDEDYGRFYVRTEADLADGTNANTGDGLATVAASIDSEAFSGDVRATQLPTEIEVDATLDEAQADVDVEMDDGIDAITAYLRTPDRIVDVGIDEIPEWVELDAGWGHGTDAEGNEKLQSLDLDLRMEDELPGVQARMLEEDDDGNTRAVEAIMRDIPHRVNVTLEMDEDEGNQDIELSALLGDEDEETLEIGALNVSMSFDDGEGEPLGPVEGCPEAWGTKAVGTDAFTGSSNTGVGDSEYSTDPFENRRSQLCFDLGSVPQINTLGIRQTEGGLALGYIAEESGLDITANADLGALLELEEVPLLDDLGLALEVEDLGQTTGISFGSTTEEDFPEDLYVYEGTYQGLTEDSLMYMRSYPERTESISISPSFSLETPAYVMEPPREHTTGNHAFRDAFPLKVPSYDGETVIRDWEQPIACKAGFEVFVTGMMKFQIDVSDASLSIKDLKQLGIQLDPIPVLGADAGTFDLQIDDPEGHVDLYMMVYVDGLFKWWKAFEVGGSPIDTWERPLWRQAALERGWEPAFTPKLYWASPATTSPALPGLRTYSGDISGPPQFWSREVPQGGEGLNVDPKLHPVDGTTSQLYFDDLEGTTTGENHALLLNPPLGGGLYYVSALAANDWKGIGGEAGLHGLADGFEGDHFGGILDTLSPPSDGCEE